MKKKRIIAILCSMMLAVQGITPAAAAELTVYEEAAADVTTAAEQAEPAEDAVAIEEGNLFVEAAEEASEYVPQDDMLAEEEAIGQESIEEVPELNGALEAEENEALPADILEEELIPEDILAAEEADLLIPEDAITGEDGDAFEEAPAEEGELYEFPEEDASDFDDPALAGAADASGTCGDNLSWSLTGGTLTITGTGNMTNFSQGRAPWDAYTDKITAVSIGEEVTSIGNYAFYFCRNLPEIVIPDSVTYIGDYAFQKCSTLKDVKIGDGVTYIGEYAFTVCAKLESVEFSANLKTIDDYAFYQCVNLKSVELPNTLGYIGYRAFQGCTGLTSVVIEEGVSKTSIGTEAYSGCTGLTSIVIPEGVTSLSENAFDGCSGLVSAELPDTLSSLSGYVFRNCTSLKSVKLGQNMTSIGNYAFSGCSSLTDITLPDSMITIYYDAFYGCRSLIEINIPAGVTTIGSEAFANCSSLTSITLPYTVSSLGYRAFSKCTSLTSVSLGDRLLSLPFGLFAGCTSLTEIEIPNSVTSLGDGSRYWDGEVYRDGGVFSDCTSLTSVTLGNRLQNIPNYAFSDCTSLNNLEIPDSVTTIGEYAFRGCSNLAELQIPDSVESIGTYAFSNCTGLTKINIPDGVGTLAERVFSECSSLTDITLGSGLTSIEKYAFYACSGLPEINIPDGVETIGEYAFNNCSSLSEITFGAGLTSIGHYAFSGCSNLGDITFGDKLTTIGGYAFSDCTGLSKITFGAGLTSLGNYAFSGCISLDDITFGDKLTSIGNNAFSECSSLKEVTLPDSVIEIGYSAFNKCASLGTVTLSDNITLIPNYAFSGCTSLESITIPAGITNMEYDAFYGDSALQEVIFAGDSPTFNSWTFEGTGVIVYYSWANTTWEWARTASMSGVKRFVGLPSALTLNKYETTLLPHGTEQIEVSDLVEGDEVVSWKSNDVYVAKVDENGLITANRAGTATITVKLLTGRTADVKVTVLSPTITVNPTSLRLSVFGSQKIEVSNLVEGDKVVSWTSSNENVATVDEEGLVTAKSSGYTYIYIKLLSGIETRVEVYVEPPTITLNPTSLRLSVFGSQKIEVSNLVEGDKVVSWTSFNENIATVDEEGLVTAKRSGSTYITVKLLSGYERRVDVIVEYPRFRLNTTSLNLQVSGTATISVEECVEGDEVVSFKSEDSTIAEVDSDGKVTAKKSGSTTITVTMKSGITAQVHVYVQHPPVRWSIEPSNVLAIGGKAKLVVEGLLEGEKAIFSVGDPSIASIDANGNITALAEGSTPISVAFDYSGQGGSSSGGILLKVIDPMIIFASDSITLKAGETKKIRVGVASGDEVRSFTSANPRVASVDSRGNVTGVSAGKTKVTVTLKSGLSGDVDITVESGTPFKQFNDVTDPSAFYYDAVYWAVDKGITTGYNDNTFRPLAKCHRAAVVTFLWRLAGKPEPESMATFTDMTGNSDFDKAISWASQSGITTGYKEDNTFRPYQPCNRAAIVTFLWRYAGSPKPNKMATFNDMTKNSDFDKAISWAYEKGITTGYAGNLFKPWDTCNRMAVVTFLYRLAN